MEAMEAKLIALEEKVKKLESAVFASANVEKLSKLDMYERVLQIADVRESKFRNEAYRANRNCGTLEYDTKHVLERKKAWKSALDHDLIENVNNILEESYDSFIEELSYLGKEKVLKIIGTAGSDVWKEFLINVITILYEKGSFDLENLEFDTFEDTAGGCDEITWYAASKYIEKSTTLLK